jgi:hypothetical protein
MLRERPGIAADQHERASAVWWFHHTAERADESPILETN